jgi:putative DNA primase/helicase
MTDVQNLSSNSTASSQAATESEPAGEKSKSASVQRSPQLRWSDVWRFHRTDAGNAELLAALFGSKLCYHNTSGRWLIWQQHRFAEDIQNSIIGFAKTAARWRARAVYQLAETEDSKDHYKWSIRSEHCSRLEAALKLARSEPRISDGGKKWDADPMLLGVQNGVVNLHTGKLRPGRPSDRMLLHSDIAFTPAALCPRWERFLAEIFNNNLEIIDYVQRAIGYCLTGDTSEQVLFLCYGTGANGKSTFLEVLRYIFGTYAYNLPFSAFELKARSAIPNEIAALSGKRFITAIETNESVELNEGRLKALTGSDPITARFLYREFFTFDPTGKFWLAFNHKPRVSDDSPGFWRRVRLIPFTRQFDESKRDSDLLRKLKAEAPGILNWAIAGALSWQKLGLKAPDVIVKASEEYRTDSDPLADFITERCEIGSKAQTTAAALWEEYRKWADTNGDQPLARKAMSQRLEARGFKKGRTGHDRTRVWIGIALKAKALVPSSALRTDADVKSPLLVN